MKSVMLYSFLKFLGTLYAFPLKQTEINNKSEAQTELRIRREKEVCHYFPSLLLD